MLYLYAVILGLLEGITEFLPISSTGHLILAGTWLRLPVTDFWKSFDIAVQLGAIGAVIAVYWRQLLNIKVVGLKVLVSFLPTAFLGVVFYSVIKKFLLGNYTVVLAALLVGGIAIVLLEKYYGRAVVATIDTWEKITWRQAVLVGLFQTIAMIPGVSRSAATILGGLSLKISRQIIVEFSFLLAVPTMLAATALDLTQSGLAFSRQEWLVMGIGGLMAFGTALLVIKWLLRFVRRHSFAVFGWYRIMLSLILLFLLYF